MDMKKIATLIISASVLTACAIANASSNETSVEKNEQLKIYVFDGCKEIDEIAMTQTQIEAYNAMKADEVTLKELEKPLKEMDKTLAKHEAALDNLSGEMVIEENDEVIVNKKLIKQHEQIAQEMESVVRSHQKDIDALELHARQFEKTARKFEKAIKPSLSQYGEHNIQVSIGKKNLDWQCEA
ncbi:hypothetical protein [Pseudoalteromonas sp. G4]|uniref:hypothetical protein n=1 Tax=Pseudoalteromonas sp. G4 TaxID=2992761 RepID=UPI00237EDC20|nr:hypothetical protein [Pseudoalteromonas sp. G4]MDE3272295.1 hypothetical protein [Pseudoalteromonas sp. G4]